ncbi:MAG: serine/threonine-protein kinase RsbW [Phycisphaerales bacterium]|jgi:serine/threonine-protein kinase RsbW|nr:serine/threonine-protein kinase RsbW [Phycisphaerales bacterium]
MSPSSTSTPPRRLELKITSHPANLAAVRKAIEAFAAANGFDAKGVDEIGLCVNEAIANIIRHAYRGQEDRPVHVAAMMEDRDGGTIVVTLRDWGIGIDPSTLPCRVRDPLEPGGIGMICLQQWMDRVTYAAQPDGGMLATMTRRRSRR